MACLLVAYKLTTEKFKKKSLKSKYTVPVPHSLHLFKYKKVCVARSQKMLFLCIYWLRSRPVANGIICDGRLNNTGALIHNKIVGEEQILLARNL